MFPILQVAHYLEAELKNRQINFCSIKVSRFVLLDTEVPVSIVCPAAPESSAFATNASNREHH